MGEKEDKEKAEKLAAAKKRVAQMQKKKKAATSTTEKQASTSKGKAKDGPKSKEKEEEEEDAEIEPQSTKKEQAPKIEERDDQPAEEENPDEAAFNDAIQSAKNATDNNNEEVEDVEGPPGSPSADNEAAAEASPTRTRRQPSVSIQSKLRSASFRQGPGTVTSPTSTSAPGIASPEGDDVQDIYRKQLSRIEELEKENKRLAKEVQDGEGRWRKNETELEKLREKTAEDRGTGAGDNEEIEKLRGQIENLRRNQRQSVSGVGVKGRTGSIPGEDVDHLKQEIDSKDSTIADLQLEISRLRSQVAAQTQGCETHGEQIGALTSSLGRAEGSMKKLETELADTKKALSRATEKAVLDGTERTSRDVRIKSMERDLEEAKSIREESEKKVEALEKKIEAMNKLHREAEQRNSTKLASVEGVAREAHMLKAKVESLEKETTRLREARKRTMSGGGADDGLEELEDEDRQKLEKKIRDLEGENFELRRGVWRDKRRELQPNLSTDGAGATGADDFDEVDLNGSNMTSRKSSSFYPAPTQTRHSGFTQVLSSGIAAFRTSTTSPDSQQMKQQNRPRNDSLLEELDDDASFDENAFAAAQREEEMKKMVEHVREIKRGLQNWKGWRLDLVDVRRSGGAGPGYGEVFEV